MLSYNIYAVANRRAAPAAIVIFVLPVYNLFFSEVSGAIPKGDTRFASHFFFAFLCSSTFGWQIPIAHVGTDLFCIMLVC